MRAQILCRNVISFPQLPFARFHPLRFAHKPAAALPELFAVRVYCEIGLERDDARP